MYDELVKRLRERSVFLFPHHGESRSYDADLMHEAADAIEELSQKMQQLPRWIPVTERKPKTDDIVIVAIHDDSGDTPYDVTNVGFYLDVFPLGVWVVENERCNYVTHWMPLPQPPKEE